MKDKILNAFVVAVFVFAATIITYGFFKFVIDDSYNGEFDSGVPLLM